MHHFTLLVLVLFGFVTTAQSSAQNNKKGEDFVEEKYGVRYADTCEVCKYLVTELDAELQESGKSHGVLEIGYHIDTPPEKRKTKKYAVSELRLIEALDGVCNRLLEYRIHKERTDSTRFAKGTSQTFQVLNNLVAKGVKVDLGIPKELWDEAPAEVTNLKTQCEKMLESHETDIEKWYFDVSEDKEPLMEYLCQQRVLRNDSEKTKCLSEKLAETEDNKKQKEEL